mgnify:CR=1 FL=1|jgi:soluble lytic murein transglycosylase-like protein
MLINKLFLCLALSSLSNSEFQMKKDSIKTACGMSEQIILRSSEKNLSPFVLTSMIWAESRWEGAVISNKGACGLTQVLPKYSKYNCKELQNPKTSIEEGSRVLSFWVKKKKDVKKALECYNSGYRCKSPKYAKQIMTKTAILKARYLKISKEYGSLSNE